MRLSQTDELGALLAVLKVRQVCLSSGFSYSVPDTRTTFHHHSEATFKILKGLNILKESKTKRSQSRTL